MKRQVFFSFHYENDNWRAGQVRNMGKVDDTSTFSDNSWEEVRKKTDDAIKMWIKDQLKMKSCLVVLIGNKTFERKWIKYEIEQAYRMNKGIVGIYIHGLKDKDGYQCSKGKNPFHAFMTYKNENLSKHVNAYDPGFSYSTNVYSDIKDKIEGLIEEAISNKEMY